MEGMTIRRAPLERESVDDLWNTGKNYEISFVNSLIQRNVV